MMSNRSDLVDKILNEHNAKMEEAMNPMYEAQAEFRAKCGTFDNPKLEAGAINFMHGSQTMAFIKKMVDGLDDE